MHSQGQVSLLVIVTDGDGKETCDMMPLCYSKSHLNKYHALYRKPTFKEDLKSAPQKRQIEANVAVVAVLSPLLIYHVLFCTVSLCGGGHFGSGWALFPHFRASSKENIEQHTSGITKAHCWDWKSKPIVL